MPAPAQAFARFSLSAALFCATLFLSACPKKQWHYIPPSPPTGAKDFDTHFDPAQLDPNGAPRNIDWAPQLQGRIPNPDNCNNGQPYSKACTQNDPFQDQPSGLHEAFCFLGKAFSPPYQSFFGHADWMVSQFNGSIGWFNFGDDWDYDLFLIPGNDHLPSVPFNAHGITTNNNHVTDDKSPQYIEMEFDSNETDPAFTEGWWNDFKNFGHDDDVENVAKLLHPDKTTLACGSALGLFGLDCDHGCRSELHPIYGIAIQTKDEANDNQWSVMMRNWGTGGYCSQDNDELAETTLSLTLPYTSSQPPANVQVKNFVPSANTDAVHIACPEIYFKDGQTVVTLTLPPPEQQPIATFTLSIQWPAGAQPVACTQPSSAPAMMAFSSERAPAAGKVRGEDYMGALVRAAAQSQNPSLKRPSLEKDILPASPELQPRLQSLKKMMLAPPSQACRTLTVHSGQLPQPTPIQTNQKLKIDPHKQIRDDAVRNYVCRTYRSKNFSLPAGVTQQDFDQACKGTS